ncbi:ABC transporter permease [Thermoflexus hugenholtzii]
MMVRAWARLTIMEVKLYLREPVAAFFTFAFAPMMLVIFGAIYGNRPTPLFGGRGMVDVSVPAYLGMIIATVGLISVPIGTAARREAKVLRRFQATPLPPAVYLSAQMAMYVGVTMLGGIALVLVGRLLFGMRFEGNPLAVVVGFILGTIAFLGLGLAVGSLAPTARVAQAVGMILAFPMMAMGGVWMPLEILPESIRRISAWLPLTHVVTLMRGLWAGGSLGSHLGDLAFLIVTGVVGGLLAARFFRWE